jgi:hypothetical protein
VTKKEKARKENEIHTAKAKGEITQREMRKQLKALERQPVAIQKVATRRKKIKVQRTGMRRILDFLTP